MNLLSFQRKKKSLSLLIFSFFFLVYIASNGGHVDEYDGIYTFLVTENFALNGSPSLNVDSPSQHELGADIEKHIRFMYWNMIEDNFYKRFSNGDSPERQEFLKTYLNDVNYKAFYGPTYLVLPTIGLPFYLLAKIINFPVIHFVPLFLNSMIVAISCTMIFLLGRELFKSEGVGFVLSLIFGVTSFIWPYITSMYANPLGIMFIITALYFIVQQRRKGYLFPFLGGICIGLSFLSYPLMLQLTPGVLIFGGVEFRKDKKKLLAFIIGFLIMVGIQAYVNYARFGSVESFGFSGSNNILDRSVGDIVPRAQNLGGVFEGIYGYLFSPGRSIFLYFPVAVLTPIGWYYLYKKNKTLTVLLVYLTLASILYMVGSNWYANPHWGPHRYLLPIIPAVTISIGSIISEFSHTLRLKIGMALFSTAGFIVNLLGTLVWTMYAYSYGWGPEGLWKIQDKDAVFAWNPYYSGPVQAIKVLLVDYVGKMQVNLDADNYLKIGLYGCSYDNYLFCTYGLIPIILLAIVISIISYFILLILRKEDTGQISTIK